MTNAPFIPDRKEEVAMITYLEDQDLGSMENHKSVIMHIISQLKDGKDLTKIVLPTFILEQRSLLEMFADYNAHPQMLIDVTNGPTPHERMKSFVKWFLTAFHASKKAL
ncbi:Oxysterol-binding protein-related protein 10 [Hymenolepis weldensis]